MASNIKGLFLLTIFSLQVECFVFRDEEPIRPGGRLTLNSL